jgi:hypothetical protein
MKIKLAVTRFWPSDYPLVPLFAYRHVQRGCLSKGPIYAPLSLSKLFFPCLSTGKGPSLGAGPAHRPHVMTSSDLGTVHAAAMASSQVLDTCASPLCDVQFQQTGLTLSPKRFCSVTCRQQASIIHRAVSLLATLGEERAREVFVELLLSRGSGPSHE